MSAANFYHSFVAFVVGAVNQTLEVDLQYFGGELIITGESDDRITGDHYFKVGLAAGMFYITPMVFVYFVVSALLDVIPNGSITGLAAELVVVFVFAGVAYGAINGNNDLSVSLEIDAPEITVNSGDHA